MRIGIPREVKPLEGRVALSPEACSTLVHHGHEVLVESSAGVLSGYADAQYQSAGAQVTADAQALYAGAELVVKVKEPVAADLAHLRRDHLLFCFLHLAPNPELTRQLLEIGLTAVGFETVETDAGQLPLLAPMSDIAGRLAVQIGTHLLHQPQGGKGLLLGGLPGVGRGHVVILGAGHAGGNAAALAAAVGAEVVVFDPRHDRLVAMRALGNNVTALYPYQDRLHHEVARADLLIGATLQTGTRTPHIVSRTMVASMQPGSVVVDISVDQGGCIETTRPTTYDAPTYVEEGVLHFCVTNMPGAVPRSATQALSAAILPWTLQLAAGGWEQHAPLQRAVNVRGGEIIHPALRTTLD
jgi:alanine dehydrogenase